MAFQFSQTGQELQYIANLAQNRIATPFSSATSYNVGDFCTRNGVLYRCTTATTGAWDSTKWSSTTAGSQLSSINTTLSNINTNLTRNSGATVSVPDNTWTLLQSLALTQGTWLVIGGCSYSSNATGQRSVVVTSSSTAPSSPRNGMRVAPTPGGITTNIWHMEFIVANPSATAYLWGVQASGDALNCFPYINAIRLR